MANHRRTYPLHTPSQTQLDTADSLLSNNKTPDYQALCVLAAKTAKLTATRHGYEGRFLGVDVIVLTQENFSTLQGDLS